MVGWLKSCFQFLEHLVDGTSSALSLGIWQENETLRREGWELPSDFTVIAVLLCVFSFKLTPRDFRDIVIKTYVTRHIHGKQKVLFVGESRHVFN